MLSMYICERERERRKGHRHRHSHRSLLLLPVSCAVLCPSIPPSLRHIARTLQPLATKPQKTTQAEDTDVGDPRTEAEREGSFLAL